MSLNSRNKGRRGEYEVARLIGGKRQALSGAIEGTNDVVPPEILASWAIEVKRRKVLPNLLTEALAQAAAATKGSMKKPMVFYREDNGRWMVAAYGDDFMQFVSALAEVGNGYAIKAQVRSIKRALSDIEEML